MLFRSKYVRIATIGHITDQDTLVRIAKEDEDKFVRRLAKARLEDIKQ